MNPETHRIEARRPGNAREEAVRSPWKRTIALAVAGLALACAIRPADAGLLNSVSGTTTTTTVVVTTTITSSGSSTTLTSVSTTGTQDATAIAIGCALSNLAIFFDGGGTSDMTTVVALDTAVWSMSNSTTTSTTLD